MIIVFINQLNLQDYYNAYAITNQRLVVIVGNSKTQTKISATSYTFQEINEISVQMGTVHFQTGRIQTFSNANHGMNHTGVALLGLTDPDR